MSSSTSVVTPPPQVGGGHGTHSHGDDHAGSHSGGKGSYLENPSGIWGWIYTVDHKRISVMYLVAVSLSFLIGGVLALLVRTEHLTGAQTIMTADTYNRVFTLHGAVMVFMFIIPGIPAAIGNFVLPLMLGAKDVAFPKINLLSFYCWVGGSIFLVIAIIHKSLDTGWTFYTPYSTQSSTNVLAAGLGAFILGFSSIFTGLNFMVTIHKLRPKGMGWFQLPLFLWALYATAVIQILATPVLGITLLLLVAELVLKVGIFDPTLGGDPILFQHFFWFYSHPAVYIMILPAMGVISEIISTHSRRHIFGYKFIAYSSIAIALLGFLVWGHHMFTSGQSVLAGTIFSFITFFIAVPSAIKVFNWLATLYNGSIRLRTPLVYALAFIWIFTIGGLTGLFLGSLATDVHLQDTYFVVAHFHYVMMGSTVMAFVGGLYHWWPKMFGKMYNETWGIIGCILVFVGLNLTFFPQFIMGAHGMPRRYFNYQEQFTLMHVLSTIGSYVMGVGFFVALGNWIHSLVAGAKAPENPWGAASLDWKTASPPIVENFEKDMEGCDPYDFSSAEEQSPPKTAYTH